MDLLGLFLTFPGLFRKFPGFARVFSPNCLGPLKALGGAPNDPMPSNHVPKLRLNESMLALCSSRFCRAGPSCEKLRF